MATVTNKLEAHPGVFLGVRADRWRNVAIFSAVLAFFFVSGACGLLYQVVWTRKLVLLFGTTSYAVSTVLSIFFLGLGIGSLWGGRLADRSERPLFLYGVMELIIGAWAVVFIVFIDAAEGAIVALLQEMGHQRAIAVSVRALLAFLFLILPVTLMGATLPLLAKFVTRDQTAHGFRIGTLYGVNTFGAVAGCAATGFVLLAAFGYTQSTLIGAAANVLVGLLAFGLSRGLERGQPRRAAIRSAATVDDGSVLGPFHRRLVLAAIALSGLCALALEVLWTRLLAILFLGTTYAFTTMLTTVLCGIALGSLFASAIVERVKNRVLWFGVIEVLIGVTCIATLAVFGALPERFQAMQIDAGYAWDRLVWVKFVVAFSVLLGPTFLFGMTFPFAVRALVGEHHRLGTDVGRLYSANTLGGVIGAILGGYILIPVLGTHYGLVLLGLVTVAVGAGLIVGAPQQGLTLKTATLAAGAAAVAAALMFAPGDVSRRLNASFVPEEHAVVHYDEGVEATVAVSEPIGEPAGSNRILWINAVQATASIEKGVKMNRLQGVLPLVFDRDPKEALFMCFGSGITAGTLALYDFENIDAVEISKDVLEAGEEFRTDNFDVLRNPKVTFWVDDGRNYLLTTEKKYDVITFEPMPLALAGVSTFYTQEYYELCLNHLKPGGIVSQWIPLHSLNTELVRSLVYTFTTVFPEYTAWFTNADLFMIGSNEPLRIDYARAKERLTDPAIQAALAEAGLGDITEVLTSFFMDKENVDAFARGGEVMTDDRPWAEFIAPKLIYERHVGDALDALAPYYQSPVVLLRTDNLDAEERERVLAQLDRRYRAHVHDLRGVKQYYAGMVGSSPEIEFRQALEIDPNDATAKYYLTEVLRAKGDLFLRWDKLDEAAELLNEALQHAPDDAEIHFLLGAVYREEGKTRLAQQHFDRFVELGGDASRIAATGEASTSATR